MKKGRNAIRDKQEPVAIFVRLDRVHHLSTLIVFGVKTRIFPVHNPSDGTLPIFNADHDVLGAKIVMTKTHILRKRWGKLPDRLNVSEG